MDEQNIPPSASDFIQTLRDRAASSEAGTVTLEKEPENAASLDVTEKPATETKGEEVKSTPSPKLQVAIKALKAMERNLATIIKLLEDEPAAATALASFDPNDLSIARELELAGVKQADGRVTEGVFDGRNMVGADGREYPVPPNYASKSKLVEGDMLKVTVTPRGNSIFKQIGPVERRNVIAALGFDPTNGEYYATSEDRRWSLLKASITFYKGEPGDDVALLVPRDGQSKWAAVENVIKKSALHE